MCDLQHNTNIVRQITDYMLHVRNLYHNDVKSRELFNFFFCEKSCEDRVSHAQFHPQVVSQRLSSMLHCKLHEKIASCNSNFTEKIILTYEDVLFYLLELTTIWLQFQEW